MVSTDDDGTSGIDAKLATQGITDTTPPDTTIDSGPIGTINTNDATFTFSSTEPPWITRSFECRVDSGAFEACSPPQTFSGLTDGEHTVAIRAEDYWGNQDQTPAIRTFTVDTTVYEAEISKVTVKGPARIRKGRKATYRVRITNSGNTKADGVGVRAKARGINLSVSVGSVSNSTTRVVKVTLMPKKPGKAKIRFRVTSSNAGVQTITRTLSVRK